MVKFTDTTARASSKLASLSEKVQSAVASLSAELRELQIHVDIEVDASVAKLNCHSHIESTLAGLLSGAIAGSPVGGDLYISACRTNRGIEIEVANSNPLLDDAPANAFSRCSWVEAHLSPASRRNIGNTEGYELYHTRCPQGGQAWTLVLIPRMLVARAA